MVKHHCCHPEHCTQLNVTLVKVEYIISVCKVCLVMLEDLDAEYHTVLPWWNLTCERFDAKQCRFFSFHVCFFVSEGFCQKLMAADATCLLYMIHNLIFINFSSVSGVLTPACSTVWLQVSITELCTASLPHPLRIRMSAPAPIIHHKSRCLCKTSASIT